MRGRKVRADLLANACASQVLHSSCLATHSELACTPHHTRLVDSTRDFSVVRECNQVHVCVSNSAWTRVWSEMPRHMIAAAASCQVARSTFAGMAWKMVVKMSTGVSTWTKPSKSCCWHRKYGYNLRAGAATCRGLRRTPHCVPRPCSSVHTGEPTLKSQKPFPHEMHTAAKWRLLLLLLRTKWCSIFVWNSQGAVFYFHRSEWLWFADCRHIFYFPQKKKHVKRKKGSSSRSSKPAAQYICRQM